MHAVPTSSITWVPLPHHIHQLCPYASFHSRSPSAHAHTHTHTHTVETVGDAYLCVANLKHPQPDSHAARIAKFAFGCLAAANELTVCLDKPGTTAWVLNPSSGLPNKVVKVVGVGRSLCDKKVSKGKERNDTNSTCIWCRKKVCVIRNCLKVKRGMILTVLVTIGREESWCSKVGRKVSACKLAILEFRWNPNWDTKDLQWKIFLTTEGKVNITCL